MKLGSVACKSLTLADHHLAVNRTIGKGRNSSLGEHNAPMHTQFHRSSYEQLHYTPYIC
jgi:hypothetical protein